MTEYTLVERGRIQELFKDIEELSKDGWRLIGPVQIAMTSHVRVYLATMEK